MDYIDKIKFSDVNNQEYSFVKFINPDKLLVWKVLKKRDVWNEEICMGINVRDVSADNLKLLSVWDSLDEKIKQEIENENKNQSQDVTARMQKARANRKLKYPNVPRELKCYSCGFVVNIPPSTIVKRVEKLGILLDDYIKNFRCQLCKPTKGRKTNPNKSLPIELICSCGTKVMVTKEQLNKRAEKKGVAVDKIIKDYKCQKCVPTIGRKSTNGKTRKIDLICKCGNKIVITPSQLDKKAEKQGITAEEVVKTFVCQKCHNTRGRKKKTI